MAYGIFTIIGIIIVPLVILWSYRKDYLRDKAEFKASLKTVAKGILGFLLFFGLTEVSGFIIPFKDNYGIEFNTERENLGIPTLEENWEISEADSKQFATYWWKPEPRNGHFKKVIEYGILHPKTETDYYLNTKRKGIYVWSVYDYKTNAFEYSIENTKEKKTIQIPKTKFDEFLIEE